jgi:hypothetical protein
MSFERRDLFIAGIRFPVIDQYPHAHAAIGRVQNGTGQQSAGLVPVEDEVLKIDGPFRGIDHLHADQEPVGVHRSDAKSGVAGVVVSRTVELAFHSRFFRGALTRIRSAWPRSVRKANGSARRSSRRCRG